MEAVREHKPAAKKPQAPKVSVQPELSRSSSIDMALLRSPDPCCKRAAAERLQQGYGNRAVVRMMRVSVPGDSYEQEADRAADAVMRSATSPEPVRIGHTINSTGISRAIDDEEKIRARRGDSTAPGGNVVNLDAFSRGGDPLSYAARDYFEPRFGRDFGDVRVHTGSGAAEAARSLGARAFAMGPNVVFGSGQYSADTSAGKRLIAHELAHVVQYSRGDAPALMRAPAETQVPEQKKGAASPVGWGVDNAKKKFFVIPKPGVSLDDVVRFLYGSTVTAQEFAEANDIAPGALPQGRPLYLIGKPLVPGAMKDKDSATFVPMGVSDPEAFLAKKREFDQQVEADYNFIVGKLEEYHYSDADEGMVIDILRKWGEEKFAVRPDLYPNGGEFLDKLLSKLQSKTKDVGIVTEQRLTYYDLIFSRFDRASEVRAVRDKYSRRHKGWEGNKESSFGSFFWNEVKEGHVRDQIFAFGKGLGKGLYSGAKGVVTMGYTLVTDPKKFFSDIAKLPGALKTMWEKKGELWQRFASASPEEQAEMIGELTGELEFMIASSAAGGAAAKGLAKAAELPGTIGKLARVAQTASKIPEMALGVAAKGVKAVVLSGGRIAAEGAIFAAKGIYRVAGKVLRGTWSVVEKTVGKIKQKVYYFFDEAEGLLKEIPAAWAKECVQCSLCRLTNKAKAVAEAVKGRLTKGKAAKPGPQTVEEYVAAGGKVTYGPKQPSASSTIADEMEGVLTGSAGQPMFGFDPVLRNLLAVKGTFTHELFNKVINQLKKKMPGNSMFNVNDWRELEKMLGGKVPWQRGKGPDLLLVDKANNRISIIDLTRKHRPSHISKTLDYADALREKFPGWTVSPDLVKEIYYVGGKTVGEVLESQLLPILKMFGMR